MKANSIELNMLHKKTTCRFIPKYANVISCLFLFLTFSQNANATNSGHPQLLRNGTLEAADLDKSLNKIMNAEKSTEEKNEKAKNKQIMQKAKELEGVFLSVMIDPMFSDGKDSDLFGGGTGQQIFRTMMIQEYGKILAENGGVGLSKGIEKQLRQSK